MTTRVIALLLFCCAAGPSAQEPAAPAEPPAYRLAAGDTIDVRFFFNPELNDVVQIRPDGRISLQLVGELVLAGRTIGEAVKAIEAAAAKEVRTPRVSIQIRTYAGQKVYVTGEVVRPGLVSLPGDMTIIEALGEAGGLLQTANRRKTILIRRAADGRPVRRELTLMVGKTLGADAQLALRPFDVIVVPESKITHVDRWVDQYIRKLLPVDLTAGFQYVYSKSSQLIFPF